MKKSYHKLGRGALVLASCLVLALIAGCAAGTATQPTDTQPTWDLTEDPNAREGGIQTRSQEEIQEELNRKVEEGMINISMNLNPVFEDGGSAGSLLIVNEEINRYPQIVEIYRKDTDELLYRSGSIPVGHSVERGELLVDLPAGDYNAIAYFNAIDPETGALVGKAGAEIVISVLH